MAVLDNDIYTNLIQSMSHFLLWIKKRINRENVQAAHKWILLF